MARKRTQEPENHERWLVSYADFITLLFAFFVVMYSTSSINEGKMRVLSDSLVASFAGRNKSIAPIQIGKLMRSPYTDETSTLTSPTQFIIVAPPEAQGTLNEQSKEDALDENEGFLGDLHSKIGAEAANEIESARGPGELPNSFPEEDEDATPEFDPTVAQAEDEALPDISSVADAVRDSMSPLIDLAEVAVRQKQSWLEIELDSSMLFVSGSARLSKRAIPVLADLAEVLNQFNNPVQVEGFTDNIPIRTLAFPSNWELSAARAASVVHLFTKQGVDPNRMIAIGYGEHRPVADNATAVGRARNRRVVIVIPADKEIRRLLDTNRIELTEGGG